MQPRRTRSGNYRIVRGELEAYGAGLIDKPQVIGLNKVDAIDPADVKKLITKLKRASKAEVLPMSGAGGDGLEAVLDRLLEAIGPAAETPVRDDGEEDVIEWSPL